MGSRWLVVLALLLCLCCLLDVTSGRRRPVPRGRNLRGRQTQRGTGGNDQDSNADDGDDDGASDTESSDDEEVAGDADEEENAGNGSAAGGSEDAAPAGSNNNDCGPRRPPRRGRRFRPGRPWPVRNCGNKGRPKLRLQHPGSV